MFTGIISSIGIIESTESSGDLCIKIACDPVHRSLGVGGFAPESLRLGDSVACNGVCLTVVDSKKGSFAAQLSPETLSRTAPHWEKGQRVNLERALKMGDELGGHLVTGHVDGIAIIKDIDKSGDSRIIGLEAPEPLAKFIAEKGSVTLDGVSLTVNKVENRRFWVNIIPHTWQNTTLSERKQGDGLNIEVDLIARYVERLHSSLITNH